MRGEPDDGGASGRARGAEKDGGEKKTKEPDPDATCFGKCVYNATVKRTARLPCTRIQRRTEHALKRSIEFSPLERRIFVADLGLAEIRRCSVKFENFGGHNLAEETGRSYLLIGIDSSTVDRVGIVQWS